MTPECRRCGRAVRTNFELFEGMHFVCFHYEFEHDPVDPDDSCGLAGCPSGTVGEDKDRMASAVRALLDDWSDGPPANWDVHSLPDYLGVLSRWLDESDEHFDGSGVRDPRDGWEVMRVALRRATLHD